MNFYLTSSAKGPLLITHSLTYSFIASPKYMPRAPKMNLYITWRQQVPKYFLQAYFPQDANGKKKKSFIVKIILGNITYQSSS